MNCRPIGYLTEASMWKVLILLLITRFRWVHVPSEFRAYLRTIGVGAQSTLGGKTFLPENNACKINKMPEFTRFLPEKYFSRFFFGGGGKLPPSPTPMLRTWQIFSGPCQDLVNSKSWRRDWAIGPLKALIRPWADSTDSNSRGGTWISATTTSFACKLVL